jgi:hypothetical protein
MVSEFDVIDRIHLKRPLYRLRKQLQRISSRKFFGFREMGNILQPCVRAATTGQELTAKIRHATDLAERWTKAACWAKTGGLS